MGRNVLISPNVVHARHDADAAFSGCSAKPSCRQNY